MTLPIEDKTYRSLLALFRRATPKDRPAPEDVLTISRAIRGGKGSVDPEFFRSFIEAGDALKRLLKGCGGAKRLEKIALELSPPRKASKARTSGNYTEPGLPSQPAKPISPQKIYDGSIILQELDLKLYKNRFDLTNRLAELLPEIQKELAAIHGEPSAKQIQVHMLMQALAEAGRLKRQAPHGNHSKAMKAIQQSQTLLNIPSEILADDDSLLLFLIARRDRISVEARHALGNLPADAFIFSGASTFYPMSTLIRALMLENIINQEQGRKLINRSGLIDHILIQIDSVLHELRRILKQGKGIIRTSLIDRAPFIYKKDIENGKKPRTLRQCSIKDVLDCANWFFNDPRASIRSIFAADELAFCALFPHYFSGDLVPELIVQQLESAGSRTREEPNVARREAVEALQEILNHYKDKEVDQSTTGEYLRNVGRLVDWNNDALKNDALECQQPGVEQGFFGDFSPGSSTPPPSLLPLPPTPITPPLVR